MMTPLLPQDPRVKKYEGNPILSKKDIPYDADLIFNAGVAKYKGQYVMIFRNDYGHIEGGRFGGTNMGIAFSDDGINWKVNEKPFITAEQVRDGEIRRMYDPRLTIIEGELYICFAVDTEHGVRGGVGKVRDDFSGFDVLSMSTPDNRNMVLFPEKIDGMYVRLERPFPVYSRGHKDKFDCWISKSPDLKYWGESELLIGIEDVPFANDKIGPAAPPIKTEKGWLASFHAVDRDDENRGKNGWENKWTKRYTGGIMLLDLENPYKVLGICPTPLLAPTEPYEVEEGFRQDVIFPGGMIDEGDGTVKIYYGSADTVECLATAKIDDLINMCLSK